MDLAEFFSSDYYSARSRFSEAARSLGASSECISVDATTKAGEPLVIDVAVLGDARPSRVVVVSSGLHGVEGFFGSAVQLALLKTLDELLNTLDDVALVLLHALNPFGFAHIRRFDDQNVDLNRNFLLPGEQFSGSPAPYAALNGLLNPVHPPRWGDNFHARAVLAIAQSGFRPLKQAVAEGQYDFPRGLFFGGHAPSPLQAMLRSRLPEWIGGAEQIIHLDFHTGLGAWSDFELLTEPSLGDKCLSHLIATFGREHVSRSEPGGVAYVVRGSFCTWCERLFPDRAYLPLCAEFGTYPPLTVLAALRAENQAHHWGDPISPSTRRAKKRLLEVFVPASADWRRRSLHKALGLITKSLTLQLDPACSPQSPEIAR